MSSTGPPRRVGMRHHKLRAPRSHGLSMSVDEMWARLSAALTQIQQHNISKLSYEEHYRYAYNLILNQQGDKLYAGVRKQVTSHLAHQGGTTLVPLFPVESDLVAMAAEGMDAPSSSHLSHSLGLLPALADAIVPTMAANERFLGAMTDVWTDHCSCMSKIRDVLKYVDRVYVPNHQRAPIWEMGLDVFRDTLLQSSHVPYYVQLMVTLLRQIYCEREGTAIERRTIKDITDMLLALPHSTATSMYAYAWEPLFLATSSEYFTAEAHRLLDTRMATYYLEETERRLHDEAARVAAYLAPSTAAPLQALVERCFLTEHLEAIVSMSDGGLVALLEADARSALERMYRLFRRVTPGLPALNHALKAYVAERGKAINERALTSRDAEAPSTPTLEIAMQWVEHVLDLKRRMDGVLYSSFQGDKSCEAAINEAMESFINMNQRVPEFLSLFIDEHLKKGTRSAVDTDWEHVLDKTMTVFRFVHEKDVFERYYKMHLTRRLLHNRSVSDDAERSMIAKLKVECGHGYVQKLQGMLNDMKLSEDVLSAFQSSSVLQASPLPLQMNVNVLTATYWPISSPTQSCVYPPVMQQACDVFEQFYASRHRGRVLTWQPSLGTAEVRVRFKARSHDLIVSTYALMVLLLFESVPDDATLSYKDMAAATQIPAADLQRTLQSLACAKYKVLRKEPKGRDVNETDVFAFNADFTCPLARIKIAQVAAKVETPQERKATTAKVEEERKNQVEACIVRIMKSRKTMTHNELVNEVVQQLLPRFQPTPALIKKRIESLLDREYLERTDTRHVYQYVA
ncbi:Cul4-RING E3 ubiquitin ligase [Malassezia pachydermatis]|uniref:Cullin-domain-containing protein n=1 Tax=Malassezia pachydermatis TaxID=77020 RepID=A0A0M8MX65_9BASI|nr:cullin-domain-containing protein [Malassezia pachydermatis]KOS15331.1 cullin-domain-containing protein [Malassezia pachydermatis]